MVGRGGRVPPLASTNPTRPDGRVLAAEAQGRIKRDPQEVPHGPEPPTAGGR